MYIKKHYKACKYKLHSVFKFTNNRYALPFSLPNTLKIRLRIIATTVAKDIPDRVTAPKVIEAVDTPIPKTIEVSIRLNGLL